MHSYEDFHKHIDVVLPRVILFLVITLYITFLHAFFCTIQFHNARSLLSLNLEKKDDPQNVAWWDNSFQCVQFFCISMLFVNVMMCLAGNIFPQNIIEPILLKYFILK